MTMEEEEEKEKEAKGLSPSHAFLLHHGEGSRPTIHQNRIAKLLLIISRLLSVHFIHFAITLEDRGT